MPCKIRPIIYCLFMSVVSAAITPLRIKGERIFTRDSLPSQFQFLHAPETLPAGVAEGGKQRLEEWWRSFADPNLDRLEELAERNNYNIRAALKRIESSRQILRQTYAGYYPSINLSAGYSIEKNSGRESSPNGPTPTLSYFNAGASMSWEIDVFGRVSAATKSGKANINVSKLDYEAMLVSLKAEVATNYGALCMFTQQLRVAKAHLKSEQDLLKLVNDRYESGLVSKLDVTQAENSVNNTGLRIPALEARQASAKNALATLCGVLPSELAALLDAENQPALLSPAGIGIPADLLRRRPDITAAEQQIASVAAMLGVAKKDYLPSLTLTASIGTSSHEFKGLFGSHSMNYSVSPQLSWTLFEGLSRSAVVAEKRADMEALIDTYNHTVLTALQEVDNALESYYASLRQLTLYDKTLATSREMLSISIDRYKLGLVNFSDVASAQLSYLSYQTDLLSARNNCFNSLVALYKALGGGWESED